MLQSASHYKTAFLVVLMVSVFVTGFYYLYLQSQLSWDHGLWLSPPMRENIKLLNLTTEARPNRNKESSKGRITQNLKSGEELDEKFLIENFNVLKTIVKPLSMKYYSKVDELMVHKLPVIDTKNWKLHRTSGEVLTVPMVQQLLRDPSYRVPNAVHYILPFSDPVLQFHHLVCILSGVWVLRPDHVILWYSREPKGENWELLKQNLTRSGLWHSKVLMAHRDVPKSVYTQLVLIREHQSDIIRMEALLVFGGIYADLDVISLRSMQPLRNFSFTIGRELPQNLCNGVFLSAPNSTLLALWHVAYQSFDDSGWGEHSLMLPNRLCWRFKEHCHVEEESLDRPNFLAKEIALIYGKNRAWNWRKKNYAMHLWYRSHKYNYNMEAIKYVDSMLGDMFRFVLFGNSTLLEQTFNSTVPAVTPAFQAHRNASSL